MKEKVFFLLVIQSLCICNWYYMMLFIKNNKTMNLFITMSSWIFILSWINKHHYFWNIFCIIITLFGLVLYGTYTNKHKTKTALKTIYIFHCYNKKFWWVLPSTFYIDCLLPPPPTLYNKYLVIFQTMSTRWCWKIAQ